MSFLSLFLSPAHRQDEGLPPRTFVASRHESCRFTAGARFLLRDIGATRCDASRRRRHWIQVRRWRRLVAATVVTVFIVPLHFVSRSSFLPGHCVLRYFVLYIIYIYIRRLRARSIVFDRDTVSLASSSVSHFTLVAHFTSQPPSSASSPLAASHRDRIIQIWTRSSWSPHRRRGLRSRRVSFCRARCPKASRNTGTTVSLCNCNRGHCGVHVCNTHLLHATHAHTHTHTRWRVAGEREDELNLPSCKHGQVRKCSS